MQTLLDIGINLVAALIGFLIGWGVQILRKAIRNRRARRFWKPFVDGDLQIVVGRFLEFTEFEQSGFLGVGDAIGLTELRAYFEMLGLRGITISYADRLHGDALKTNLILLGGPDANAITKEAVRRIKSTLRFGNPARYEIAVYDSSTDKTYAPSMRIDESEISTDYGIILRRANPFARNKQVIIIAGSYGYGTWAGIRYAISRQFLDHSIVSNGKSLECLIETDVVYSTPQDIRLVVLRSLEDDKKVEEAQMQH